MTISEGDRLPDATFLEFDGESPREVPGADVFAGRKVVLFGLPGAFTRTCTAAHLPSFMRTAEAFRARGVDAIVCVAVNDPFVMKAWSDASGAGDAGVRLLADASGTFTRAMGLAFDVPATGLYGRSRRYASLVEDGVVTVLNLEPGRECNISAGEALLDRV
jgi:cytochrome c peroxidase